MTPHLGEWRIENSDRTEMAISDWTALRDELVRKGCRRHDVDFPGGRWERSVLGYFDCNGTGIEVERLSGSSTALTLRRGEPQPVIPSVDPIWEEGKVVPLPQALERAGQCVGFDHLQLLDGGTVRGRDSDPRVNVGSWSMDDGVLTVSSAWAEAGDAHTADSAPTTFTCVDAKLWVDGRVLGWACRDRFVACEMISGLPGWIAVSGPDDQREAVGRALGATPRFGFFAVIPHAPSDASGLVITYQRGNHRIARDIEAIMERDLGARATVLQDSDAMAPVVVRIGADVELSL